MLHTPNAGAACSNGNPCDGFETCNASGQCVTDAPWPNGTACGGGDACNSQECQQSVCVEVARTGSLCDDGNPCTTSDACTAAGACQGTAASGSCSDGNACNGAETCSAGACQPGIPPSIDDGNPSTLDTCDLLSGVVGHSNCVDVADLGVAVTTAVRAKCLYTGPTPVQPGIAGQPFPTSIDPYGTSAPFDARRVAILRGQVQDSIGNPLEGARVTVRERPESGYTASREDGVYDLVVEGGTRLTIDFELPGHLPAMRQVSVRYGDWLPVPDVALMPLDPVASPIDLDEAVEYQVARGSPSLDERGYRQATVLYPPGTQATVLTPDGNGSFASAPLTGEVLFRATEYTVGPTGATAMPMDLPPTSAFTYATEFAVDGVAPDATVEFSGTGVVGYLENFLEFFVGENVPVGYLDRERAQWVPSDNGRVIEITGIIVQGGVPEATVDTVGSTSQLTLSLPLGERRQLAALYQPGQTLWRFPMSHFTPWDCNWAFGPPPNAQFPKSDPRVDTPVSDPNCKLGSIIECENQILGETIDLVGAPFDLHYQTDRQIGFARTLHVPLIEPEDVHPDLVTIIVDVRFAGWKYFKPFFAPNFPTDVTVPWNGKDGFGVLTQGAQHAYAKIGFVYKGDYNSTPGFSAAGDVSASLKDTTVTLWRYWHGLIGGYYAAHTDLGGWDLTAHHFYDPTGRVLYQGDGARRDTTNIGNVIDTFAGSAHANGGCNFGTQPAEGAKIFPAAIDIAPDGSIIIADSCNTSSIKRISNGLVETILGAQPLLSINGLVAAPDGSIYYTRNTLHDVRRLDAQGNDTLVAGTGVACPNGPGGGCGDGGPASQAQIGYPWGIALGPDGSLYISELNAARVRRIDPPGVISTIAGGSAWCHPANPDCGDGDSAVDATLTEPRGVAVSDDGIVFIADMNRVRGITPDGTIHTVAGKASGSTPLFCGPADASAANCRDLLAHDVTVAPDGLYIATGSSRKVYRVSPPYVNPSGPTGTRHSVAGISFGHPECQYYECPPVGCDPINVCGDGFPPNGAAIGPTFGVAVDADGAVYIADDGGRVEWIKPSFPGISIDDFVIVSEDASQYFVFNPDGRHVETRDAITNRLLMSFSGAPVTTATDSEGRSTSIVRTPQEITITPPSNQPTVLGLTEVALENYATSVTNPANETHLLTYYDYPFDGLLETFTDPRANTTTFAYAELGYLEHEWRPDDGYVNFTRERLPLPQRGHTVAVADLVEAPLTLRTTTHLYERDGESELRTTTPPDGLVVTSTKGADGTESRIYPDGTTLTRSPGPDPRFALQAPVAKQMTVTTGGKTMTISQQRDVVLADPNQLTTVLSQTDSVTVNGRTLQTVFDGASSPRTVTTTTHAGRQQITTLDANDRASAMYVQNSLGLLLVEMTYYSSGPAKGRMHTARRGSGAEERIHTFVYDALGRRHVVTAPEGVSTTYGYDDANRVTSWLRSDGSNVLVDYDLSGNLSQVVPPGKPAHELTYTGINFLDTYEAPGATPVDVDYTLDRQHKKTTLPSTEAIESFYDEFGRLDYIQLPGNTIDYEYVDLADPSHPGKLDHVSSAQDGITVGFAYTGSLVASTTWSGAVSGSVSWTYDDDFRVVSETVGTTPTVSYGYGDGDGLLTQAGALTLIRDPETGLLTGTVLENIVEDIDYNSFGEVEHRDISYLGGASPVSLLTLDYEHDGLGRITKITESVQGGPATVTEYEYDTAGRLYRAFVNGLQTAEYGYDLNGNRTYVDDSVWSAATCTPDGADRLLSCGGTSYGYDDSGDRVTSTVGGLTTEYDYGAAGELRAVTPPGGPSISYVTDPFGRRIGKRVGGVLTKGWLYQGSLRPVAQVGADGSTIEERYVYATGINVPDYSIQSNGSRRRFITDHLGSIRLVVDAATGVVYQVAQYDAFGRRSSSGATAHPFGFAGGLYDAQTGLVRFGARDYDPETGTWLARDPIGFSGGDTNLYAYVGGSPINYIDPTGHVWWIVGGAVLGAGVDLGLQLYGNGGNIGSVDWGEVAAGGVAGAVLGAGGEFLFGTLFSATSSSGTLVAVTQYGGAAAEGSPWVMVGGNTLRNWLMAGGPQLGYAMGSATTWFVDKSQLSYPNGWQVAKGCIGQRIVGP
ncbi:MAG: RHS repeat-associated core domain-containing protein [Polyangiaceae bacterium]